MNVVGASSNNFPIAYRFGPVLAPPLFLSWLLTARVGANVPSGGGVSRKDEYALSNMARTQLGGGGFDGRRTFVAQSL
jgi:hypothetical protein